MRLFIGLAMLVSVLVLVTACWPFNTAPIASFTASALSGTAPLTVNFSAILSNDPDGIITTYEWDFGDGTSGTGESASHTYTASGTFTIVLRVTDDDGAQDTAQKTITVLPGGGNGGGGTGPTASFTATPLTGASPLTVTFNASASSYAGHAITYYSWDFGDGVTGTGMTTSHTYSPSVTTTYHVVLRIIASDNTEGTASKDITVTVSTPTPPSTAPTASFTTSPNTVVAPRKITCDGGASSAAAGRTLTEWIWRFGDGTSPSSLGNDTPVDHRYTTDRASESFTVTLIVIDDADGTNTAQRSVIVENKQPVAGFEINDAPGGSGNWLADDVTFDGVATQTASVKIRSEAPTNMTGTTPTPNDGTQDDPEPKTAAPGNYGDADPGGNSDHDLCYDPEGQDWSGDTPYGWPNPAWGIEWYKVNWGDGSTQFVEYATLPGLLLEHTYDVVVGANNFTITVTAIDYLGAETSYSRTVTINRTT
jgi:PKD repeat protein